MDGASRALRDRVLCHSSKGADELTGADPKRGPFPFIKRPRRRPASITNGAKNPHSSSDINPRTIAALPQRAALNQRSADLGIHFVNRT